MSKRDMLKGTVANRPNGLSTPKVTLSEAADTIFGEIDKIESIRQVANPLDIFQIYPDPNQPRRTIPNSVRQKSNWDESPEGIQILFQTWQTMVEEERRSPFDIQSHLLLKNDANNPDDYVAGTLEDSLNKIISLASSIREEGLTNPITVARYNTYHIIETGERRWLAFHLLNLLDKNGNWTKIPARIVNTSNVWRQAFENNARDDLNAISRARQLALLLMDLYSKVGSNFRPREDFSHELDFYAQVKDGNVYSIPNGKWDIFLTAMGLKNKVQLRQYRGILKIDREFWDYADEHNLTEGEIREARKTHTASSTSQDTKQALDEPIWIDTGAEKPFAKSSHTHGTKPKNNTESESAILPPPLKSGLIAGTRQHYYLMVRYVNQASTGDIETNQRALQFIKEFRYWLDVQEARINDFDE